MNRLLLSALLLPGWLAIAAQSTPGGVAGAELWFHTELQDGYLMWADQSGDATRLKKRLLGSETESLYQIPDTMPFCFNFHPALYFPNLAGSYVYASLLHTDLRQSTHMGVFAPLPLDQSSLGSAPYTLTRFSSSKPSHSLWDEETTSSITFPPTGFHGYIPEYIVWQRILNPLERLQAESYLALKYGITLSSSYYDADGNIIWDRDANSTYHHRVAGLTHESHQQSLLPYMSTSSYEYAGTAANPNYKQPFWQNTVGGAPSADHLLVMGRMGGTPMAVGEYLVWGDNQGTLTASNVSSDDFHFHYMPRKWRVHTANSDSSTHSNIAILNYGKIPDANLKNHRHGRTVMIIAPKGCDDFSHVDSTFRFASYASHNEQRTTINFENFTFNDGDTFTFGWTDALIAEFTPHESACNSQGEDVMNGSIDIRVICGEPVFNYKLEAMDVAGFNHNQVVCAANFPDYSTTIYNLKAGRYRLTVVENLQSFTREVTVGSDCLGIENGVHNVNPSLSDRSRRRMDGSSGLDNLGADSLLTFSPSATPLTFTARLNASGQAMLLVYTTGGVLLSQHCFSSGMQGRECTFSVPRTGVYVIKAVTDTDEYGRKLIAK